MLEFFYSFKLSIIYSKRSHVSLDVVQFRQFHDVYAFEVVGLSCFILQQEIFTPDMKSSELELWKISSFAKAKGDHKVLRFGSKSS